MTRGVAGARELLLRAETAPLWLYRRDLGFFLGKRFLYLAHQGRFTGLRYETVLEVGRLDHHNGEVIVIAVRGNGTDWLRDIRAGRALELRIGHLRFAEPEHRVLSDEECRSLLVSWCEARPIGWRVLTTLFELPLDPKNDDLGTVRAVAFRPHVPADTD